MKRRVAIMAVIPFVAVLFGSGQAGSGESRPIGTDNALYGYLVGGVEMVGSFVQCPFFRKRGTAVLASASEWHPESMRRSARCHAGQGWLYPRAPRGSWLRASGSLDCLL